MTRLLNTIPINKHSVIFAGMFGHGQDGTLLEFESKKIKEAPKVQF